LGRQALKKVLLILVAVVLAPVLLMNLLLAAGDWREIGQTSAGDRVYVSAVRAMKGNQRVALVRVQFSEPKQLPQGGPFVEMRARVRAYCSTGQVAPSSEWFYTRDRSGRFVVSKKANRDDQFGKASEGGFLEMVSKAVCSQK
jgi:hypothetical protein